MKLKRYTEVTELERLAYYLEELGFKEGIGYSLPQDLGTPTRKRLSEYFYSLTGKWSFDTGLGYRVKRVLEKGYNIYVTVFLSGTEKEKVFHVVSFLDTGGRILVTASFKEQVRYKAFWSVADVNVYLDKLMRGGYDYL